MPFHQIIVKLIVRIVETQSSWMSTVFAALWFREPPDRHGDGEPRVHASHLSKQGCRCTHLPALTAVGPHQCDRTSALLAPQPGSHIAQRALPAACPLPHAHSTQHTRRRLLGNTRPAAAGATWRKIRQIWRHENKLILEHGERQRQPAHIFAIQSDCKLVPFSSDQLLLLLLQTSTLQMCPFGWAFHWHVGSFCRYTQKN